jgi:hypothetical protein
MLIIDEKRMDQFDKKLDGLVEEVSKISKDRSHEEKWLDNADVCKLLKVSSRTLQNYRDDGILPYAKIGRKCYYSASDIEDILQKHYVRTFTSMRKEVLS